MQQFAFQMHIDTLIALGQKSAIAARMLNPIPLDLSGGGSHAES